MGEYAELALSRAMRRGIPAPRTQRAPTLPCPYCDKRLYSDYGRQLHVKSKHADVVAKDPKP